LFKLYFRSFQLLDFLCHPFFQLYFPDIKTFRTDPIFFQFPFHYLYFIIMDQFEPFLSHLYQLIHFARLLQILYKFFREPFKRHLSKYAHLLLFDHQTIIVHTIIALILIRMTRIVLTFFDQLFTSNSHPQLFDRLFIILFLFFSLKPNIIVY